MSQIVSDNTSFPKVYPISSIRTLIDLRTYFSLFVWKNQVTINIKYKKFSNNKKHSTI